MISKTFQQFGEIEINIENCSEILSEAKQIMELAVELRTIQEYERIKSIHHGMQIRRGLKWKKENASKELGVTS